MPSTFKVPLEEEKKNHKKDEIKFGKHRVAIAEEPCLTCGHYKRLQWMERVDGKKVMKEACLFCITKFHTAANREGP